MLKFSKIQQTAASVKMELDNNGTCQLAIGHADANMDGAREEPKVEPSIDEPEDDKVWKKNIISLPILIICM